MPPPNLNLTVIKSLLKRALYSVAPQTAATVMAARARAQSHRMVKAWGLYERNQQLIRAIGNAVIAGPFAGLKLGPMACEEHVGPYLLGTYEPELHRWWERVFRQSFPQILDVGAKIGYYAVGLARQFPNATVIAFDTDPWARKAVGEVAAANPAARVRVEGFCSPAWLERNLEPGALILSDCEGYERELFCTTAARALDSATMIIETHDTMVPGVRAAIMSRFSGTHEMEQIPSGSVAPRLPPRPAAISEGDWQQVGTEVHSERSWVFLVPKA